MRSVAVTCTLWIAALTLAIAIGGNLFQAMVVDPVWSASPPESVKAFGQSPYFGRLKTFHTNPVFLLGLLCLLVSPILAWDRPDMRAWLLAAAGLYALVMIGTFTYFWPLNDALMERGAEGLSPATAAAMTKRWILVDRIRYLFRLAAFGCVLRAMIGRWAF